MFLSRPTFGDLFSGVGGISLGLERAGWECVWQVESDPYCRRVLEKHWPKLNDYRYGDIHEIDWTGIQRPNLIAGGFPCQPVSVAGRQLAHEDERWLWPEFLGCIRFLRPELVLVENVPGLLVRGGLDVLRDLTACGYDVEWDTLPASAFGAPHLRYRVFLVGYLTRPPGRVPDTERSDIRVERGCRWKQHGERRSTESRADGSKEHVADSEVESLGTGLRKNKSGTQRRRRPSNSGSPNSDVADANGGGFEGVGLSKSTGVFRERGSLSNGRSALWEFVNSTPLADAFGSGLEGHSGDVDHGNEPGRIRKGSSGSVSASGLPRGGAGEHWATEPNVGRVAHGVPSALDVAGIVRYIGEHGSEREMEMATASAEGGAAGRVRILRLYLGLTTSPPELEYAIGGDSSVSEVPHRDREGPKQVGPWPEKEAALCDLRKLVSAKPLKEAQNVQSEMPINPREVQRWLAVGKRVNRLRALGNSVVPQVIEWIGKRILEIYDP